MLVHPRKYCSTVHQHSAKRAERLEQWLSGVRFERKNGKVPSWVRDYLIETRGEKCEICGWCERHPTTDRVPLQVDHVDGDNTNHAIENLKLLCPNHHSLTLTWGFIGRSWSTINGV